MNLLRFSLSIACLCLFCSKDVFSSLDSSNTLKVALIQPHPEVDAKKSLAKGIAYCREAKANGADIVLFPEMYSLGYYTDVDFDKPDEVAAWRAMAQRTNGAYVTRFQSLAKELDMAIAITYLEDIDGELRNAATLFDRHGKRLYTYHKVHTCVFFPMEGALAPGDDFYVAELDTRLGPVQVGTMTCYDREFPESARVLMLKGAELILTPNACGLKDIRLKQFRVRAWENSVAVAMANYATGQGNGNSCVYQANGDELLLAGGEEGVFYADIDLDELRNIRSKTFWGNAWRKPEKYEALLSKEVNEPFLRKDAYGRSNQVR